MKAIVLSTFLCTLSSCAILHHTQVGEIDNRKRGKPFELLVSETGVNIKEARDILKATSKSKQAKQMDDLAGIISLFQMGPRTGNMVFDDSYADEILELIAQECPSGKVTGLNSIRETAKYPVVSGEIVKVTGYCL